MVCAGWVLLARRSLPRCLAEREGGIHHLRKHLKELVGLGVLDCRGGRYLFSEFGAFCLNFERAENGELDTDERVRADHADQRARFLLAWEKDEVRSSSKPSPSMKPSEALVPESSQAEPDLEVLRSPSEVFTLARQYFERRR